MITLTSLFYTTTDRGPPTTEFRGQRSEFRSQQIRNAHSACLRTPCSALPAPSHSLFALSPWRFAAYDRLHPRLGNDGSGRRDLRFPSSRHLERSAAPFASRPKVFSCSWCTAEIAAEAKAISLWG